MAEEKKLNPLEAEIKGAEADLITEFSEGMKASIDKEVKAIGEESALEFPIPEFPGINDTTAEERVIIEEEVKRLAAPLPSPEERSNFLKQLTEDLGLKGSNLPSAPAQELDIDYDGEYQELMRLQAQAAQEIGPLVQAQALPLIFICHLSLRVHGLTGLQIKEVADHAKFLIDESIHGDYKGQEEHAGELCIHFAASNKDELIKIFSEDSKILSRFLSLHWLNQDTKESKKEWRLA